MPLNYILSCNKKQNMHAKQYLLHDKYSFRTFLYDLKLVLTFLEKCNLENDININSLRCQKVNHWTLAEGEGSFYKKQLVQQNEEYKRITVS